MRRFLSVVKNTGIIYDVEFNVSNMRVTHKIFRADHCVLFVKLKKKKKGNKRKLISIAFKCFISWRSQKKKKRKKN